MINRLTILAGASVLALMLAAEPSRAATAAAPTTLEEIIVTAEKREQSLKDVPAAVTAIQQETLIARGATSLADMASFVPGLNVGAGTAGNTVVIRGINTGSDAAAASGVTIDGAPIGSSSSFLSGSSNAFDLGVYDIQRLEVLRGPQGTLYGASTLGGLVSYVSRRPSLSGYGASAGGEVATTRGGDMSDNLRGAVEGPLSEGKVGLRLSAFDEEGGGFIDNATTHQTNINGSRKYGARAALFAKPNESFTANFWVAYQRTEHDGEAVIATDSMGHPLTGDLDYDQFVAPSRNQSARIVYGSLGWDLGSADLTYIGAYQNIDSQVTLNYSNASLIGTLRLLGNLGLAPAFPTPGAATLSFNLGLKKYSHELRIASKADGPLTWVAGAFYTTEDATNTQQGHGLTTSGASVIPVDPFLLIRLATDYKEYAGFGNLTYAVTPKLDLTVGLRLGEDRQHFQQFTSGADVPGLNALLTRVYGPAAAFLPVTPRTKSAESVKTYLADAKYRFSDDLSGYVRFATGYRPGGPNVNAPGTSPTFHSDSVESYELGLKGETSDRKLRADLAAFSVEWSNIQLGHSVNGISSRANAGKASSRGVEATFAWLATEGLTLGGNIAYTHAQLDEDAPDVGGRKGDPLPVSPKWGGALTADYEWPISGDFSGVAGGVIRFAGDRHTSFALSTAVPDIRLRSYVTADARVGVRADRWEVTGFVRNIGDERAELAGRSGAGLNEVTIARPRTVGVAVNWRY